jgi:hypothetical protein
LLFCGPARFGLGVSPQATTLGDSNRTFLSLNETKDRLRDFGK